MNDRDSELMAQILAEHDYQRTERPEEADLILINTCSIRQKAEEKAYSLLGRLKCLKTRRPALIIGLGGCVAQQEGEKLLERIPHLDLVFGTRWISRLPGLVKTVETEGRRLSQTQMEPAVAYRPSSSTFRSSPVKASVTIMQGCNNYCAYCVVPYVRDRRSVDPAGKSAEVQALAVQELKEVLLFGQNAELFRSVGRRRPGFVQLLERLERSRAERIRFTTSHPKDLSPALTRCFGRLSKLCEHILPFRPDLTRCCKSMNRRYTRDLYLERIARSGTNARDRRHGRCPGRVSQETAADFEQTLANPVRAV
jgi:tRNA-2-methylthio-N6-dimethylallyladenosine synthase